MFCSYFSSCLSYAFPLGCHALTVSSVQLILNVRFLPGLATNSIFHVSLLQSRIIIKCVELSRFASVNKVSGPPDLLQHTWWYPCISVVPDATHKRQVWGFLKEKRPSRARDWKEGFAGRNKKRTEQYPSTFPGKAMIWVFLKSKHI